MVSTHVVLAVVLAAALCLKIVVSIGPAAFPQGKVPLQVAAPLRVEHDVLLSQSQPTRGLPQPAVVPTPAVRDLKRALTEHYPELMSDPAALQMQVLLLRLFDTVQTFFESNGVSYWLDYGTLLGALRDRRLLRGDHDCDFSVRYDGWDRIVANKHKLKEYGCRWTDNSHRHKGRRKAVIACKWFHRSKTEGADVYGWGEDSGHFLPPTREGCRKGLNDPSQPCAVCPVPQGWILPLNCSAELFDRKVCVPSQPVVHLSRIYGTLERGAKCDRRRCCVSGTAAP